MITSVRFSLVAASGAALHCGAQVSHCSGVSCCQAQALGAQASVVAARELSSCGPRAQLLRGTWNLLRPGREPLSPALADFSPLCHQGSPRPLHEYCFLFQLENTGQGQK